MDPGKSFILIDRELVISLCEAKLKALDADFAAAKYDEVLRLQERLNNEAVARNASWTRYLLGTKKVVLLEEAKRLFEIELTRERAMMERIPLMWEKIHHRERRYRTLEILRAAQAATVVYLGLDDYNFIR